MSSVSISIRPATTADEAAVLNLAPRLTEGVAPWRNQAQALAAARSWLTGSLTDAAAGTGTVLVATIPSPTASPTALSITAPPATDILGVLSIRPIRHFTGEQDGYIGELAVAEHAARQGIGRALIDAAESWARDAGLTNLTLHTGAYNTSARAFYAALGFAEEEVRLTRPVSPVTSLAPSFDPHTGQALGAHVFPRKPVTRYALPRRPALEPAREARRPKMRWHVLASIV